QRVGLGTVDLGPGAARCAPCKALQPRRFVQRSLLAVDPTPGERSFERRRVRERAFARALLGDAKEDAGGLIMVGAEPSLPSLRTRQLKNGTKLPELGLGGHSSRTFHLRVIAPSKAPRKGIRTLRLRPRSEGVRSRPYGDRRLG